MLQKQVKDLQEKSKDSEYVIKAKLQEKFEQFKILIRKQEKFEQLIQSLIDTGQLKPAALLPSRIIIVGYQCIVLRIPYRREYSGDCNEDLQKFFSCMDPLNLLPQILAISQVQCMR